jgi:threonine dehydratase
VRAVICMPEQANPVKVESMRALGAEVVFSGRDFDEAREYCEKRAAEHGFAMILGEPGVHVVGYFQVHAVT